MVTSRSFSMSHMAPESPLGLGSPCCPLPLDSTRLSCIIPELLNWAPFYFLGGLLLHILLKILLKRKSSHGILQCHSCGFLTKGAPRGEGFFPLWFLKGSCPPWQGSMAETAQLVAAAGGGGSLTFQSTSKLRKTDQNLQRPAPSDLLLPFRLLLPVSTAFRIAPPAGDCVHKTPSCGGKFQFQFMTTGEYWLIVFRFATKSKRLLYIWDSCVWPSSVCSLVCPSLTKSCTGLH